MDDPFTTEIDVQFRDLDPMGHVNNAVYASYMEQTRSEYAAEVVGVSLGEEPTVIVRQEIDYRRPIEWGETVRIDVSVTEVGESSLTWEYELRVEGELAAIAEAVTVYLDWESMSAQPLPEEWQERIEAFEA